MEGEGPDLYISLRGGSRFVYIVAEGGPDLYISLREGSRFVYIVAGGSDLGVCFWSRRVLL